MIRLLLGLVIFGGVLIFWGVQEMRVGSEASSTPQKLTTNDLVTKGYGDNAYVTLTDYLVSDDGVVESTSEYSTTYERVWMVIYPKDIDNEENVPAVIVRSKSINNDREWDAFAATKEATGLIVNTIDSLDNEERKLLRQGMPSGVSLEGAYILDLDREPSSGMGVLYIAGGGGLILLPLGVLFFRGKQGA